MGFLMPKAPSFPGPSTLATDAQKEQEERLSRKEISERKQIAARIRSRRRMYREMFGSDTLGAGGTATEDTTVRNPREVV